MRPIRRRLRPSRHPRLAVAAECIEEAAAKLLHACKLRSGAEPTIAGGVARFPLKGAIPGSFQLAEVRRTTIEDFFFPHLHQCHDIAGELDQARQLLIHAQETTCDLARTA
jgi:hypothetical protein